MRGHLLYNRGQDVTAVDQEIIARLDRIEKINRPSVSEAVRPMRSAWWLVPFAGLLSVEWIFRRRRGLQ